MFCPKCGTAAKEGDTFCGACGSPLPPSAEQPAQPPAPVGPPPVAATPPAPPAPTPDTPPPLPAQAPPPPPVFAAEAGAAPPPPAGPPPQTAAGGTGGKKSRTPLIVAIVVVAVLLVAAAAAAALVLGKSDKKSSSGSPSPTASPLATSSASPSASATGVVAGGEPALAYVFGARSDQVLTEAFSVMFGSSAPAQQEPLVMGGGRPLTELAWSPDGARLAYLQLKSLYSFASTLFLIDPIAHNANAVSFGAVTPSMVRGFAWISPTELIAAPVIGSAKGSFANGTLYRCDASAGTAEPFTDANGNAVLGVAPSASSDGALLAFVSYQKTSSGGVKETLRVVDLASGDVTDVASSNLPAYADGNAFDHPLLSPDGTAIFTEQTGSDVGFGVTVYGTDGSVKAHRARLLFPSGAAWDPSGSGMLAFGGRTAERGSENIYIYDDGTGAFTVAHKLKGEYLDQFGWSADGTLLGYTVFSPRHNYRTDDLFVTHIDSSATIDHTNDYLVQDANWPAFTATAPAGALPTALASPSVSASPTP